MISQARLKELLRYDPETGLFTRLQGRAHNAKVGDPTPGTADRRGYRVFNLDGKVYYAHRLAWLITYGEWPPKGVDIDHINRDKSDNRVANLRLLSRQMNSFNRGEPKHNTSGQKGVSWCKHHKRWVARIMLGRRNVSLGYYRKIEDAIAARLEGERVHLGGG